MNDMATPHDTPPTGRRDLPPMKLRSREERRRHWAEISAGRCGPEVESSPELQELLRSQEEFRARIKEAVRKIAGR